MNNPSELTQDEINALAKERLPDAALQRAMTQEIARVEDTCVYGVVEDWVKKELLGLDYLKHANNLTELETLMRDSTTKAIYVPKSSELPLPLVSDTITRTMGRAPVFMDLID